jgi:hypothetical protein
MYKVSDIRWKYKRHISKTTVSHFNSGTNNVLPDQWMVCLGEKLASVLLQLPIDYQLIPPFPYKIAFQHLPTEAIKSLRTQYSVTDNGKISNVYHTFKTNL